MNRNLVGTLLAIAMASTSAMAAGTSSTSSGGSSAFALGLQFGGADGQDGYSGFSGITARVGRERTIEGVLAFNGSTWILNGNFLVHSRNMFRQDPISELKFYGGFGLGVWTGGDGGFWAQVPLGVDIGFSIPVEASLYIAPGIDIAPHTDSNVHYGLGLRYWFQ
jgi:hypothetical protein